MVVEETVPEVGVRDKVALNVPPDVKEISNPVGAVIIKSAVRSVALTVKLCSVETVPAHVLNVLRLPPLEIVGVAELVINATFVVLPAPDAVTELTEKPMFEVLTVVLLVNVTVYVPSLLSITEPKVPSVDVTITVPPVVVRLAPVASFNCTVSIEVLVPFANILLKEAEIVDLVGSAATGTDPQIAIVGVVVQLNVASVASVEVPSPILP